MAGERYELKFTPKAEEDLDELYGYIILLAEKAATDLMDKFEASILRLKDYAYSCSFVVDEPLRSRGYRKLIVDNYIAFYLVDETEHQIIIMRILFGASNYQAIL
jgi:addiction module RelE/StbE family toxin